MALAPRLASNRRPHGMALPALMEELVEEILLRIPPDEPAHLIRAALVCKDWCRVVSGGGFRRRCLPANPSRSLTAAMAVC